MKAAMRSEASRSLTGTAEATPQRRSGRLLSALAGLLMLLTGSVLAQTNSTPWTAQPIMCSTALPPPPPTPITLICVPKLNSSTSIISMLIFFS